VRGDLFAAGGLDSGTHGRVARAEKRRIDGTLTQTVTHFVAQASACVLFRLCKIKPTQAEACATEEDPGYNSGRN
jgi:hypothetical protein